ncbi:nuclear transport factor 2 family protein [Actinomadura rudentiformis]|uniref:Nuclear transport factor 2 family protein n=1 Tax=Actinomadura rudentiformis TaxID=359158 RepID=A0A6H9Y7W2_9ACTN|nr:nuclear transport factor 2 family protein [Actinomadura rudentiformis]KAB2340861.1 nuclear transport factor 2 family protein [Actinomadura rudentiformis]
MTGISHDTDVHQLQRQLQELTDRVEVTDLIRRLYRWLDEGIGDPRSVFADDVGADTPAGQVQGIDRVIALATRNQTPDQRHHHLVTNPLVELDGDHAVVHTNMLLTIAPSTAAPGALAPEATAQVGGRSRFEATRTAEGWRLSQVQHRPMWFSGSLDGVTAKGVVRREE